MDAALRLECALEIPRAHEQGVRTIVIIDRARPVISGHEFAGLRIARSSDDEVVRTRRIVSVSETPSNGFGSRSQGAAPAAAIVYRCFRPMGCARDRTQVLLNLASRARTWIDPAFVARALEELLVSRICSALHEHAIGSKAELRHILELTVLRARDHAWAIDVLKTYDPR
jgi:hypothetical protein